jgi:hypothetical protein
VTGLASAAATFVAVPAKSNHQRSKHTRESTYAGQTAPGHGCGAAGVCSGHARPAVFVLTEVSTALQIVFNSDDGDRAAKVDGSR